MRTRFIPHKTRRREEWETGNENVMYCISWLKRSSTSTEFLITTTSFEFYGLYSQSSCLCCEGHKDIPWSPFLIPSCHSWFYGIPSLSLNQANIGLVCVEALYSMQVCVVYMYSVYHMHFTFRWVHISRIFHICRFHLIKFADAGHCSIRIHWCLNFHEQNFHEWLLNRKKREH